MLDGTIRDSVAICGNACERAMRNEFAALAIGEFEEAAAWADRAVFWSEQAFVFAAAIPTGDHWGR